MKAQLAHMAIAALLSLAHAFPRMTPQLVERALQVGQDGLSPADQHAHMVKRRADIKAMMDKRASTTFDPSAQYIDVSGAHSFTPPNLAAGDQRGPCPGLNALANHNFLPHNGVANIPTIINAVNQVYSMSLDLGAFLAVFGTVFDGNPLSADPGYSIGGYSPDAANILNGGGISGTPSGLSGSHNKYESDVSPTRGDLYITGDSYRVVLERFKDYFRVLPRDMSATEQYHGLADFHGQRFDESVATNPYFFYSPFAGLLVSPAGYSFPVRMMANHSAQYPDGYLSPENLMSFFGIYGDSSDIDSFEYREGWEQIPKNWYKRPETAAYSIPAFLLDVVDHGLKHPQLLSITANAGKVNTPTVLDLGDLTGGVFNTKDLADPDYLGCFLLQITQAALPDTLGTTFSHDVLGKAFQPLADQLQNLVFATTCPQLTKFDWHEFDPYPGYAEKYSGYDGKLVPDQTGLAGSGLLNRAAAKRQAVTIPSGVSEPLLDYLRAATNDLDLPNPPNSANGR